MTAAVYLDQRQPIVNEIGNFDVKGMLCMIYVNPVAKRHDDSSWNVLTMLNHKWQTLNFVWRHTWIFKAIVQNIIDDPIWFCSVGVCVLVSPNRQYQRYSYMSFYVICPVCVRVLVSPNRQYRYFHTNVALTPSL